MLDINLIREQPDLVRQALQSRQMDPAPVDASPRSWTSSAARLIQEVEVLKAERNAVSKEIGKMKDPAERQAKIDAMRQVGDQIAALDEQLRQVEAELNAALSGIPNLPDPRTPLGPDEDDNVVLRTVGQIPEFDFKPKPHWDLGPALGIIDFEQGVKITGSRFYVLSGAGARLQRALIAYMLDLHTRQGYTEKYTALHGQGGHAVRRRAAAQVCRQPVPRPRGRPVDGADRRSAADRTAHGRNPGGSQPAAPVHRLYALLPAREDERRAGCARHQARSPVRQSGDVHLLQARGVE